MANIMTEKQYYELTEDLRKKRGVLPYEVKRTIVEILKNNPQIILYPATDNEIEAIKNYLNHKKSDEIWMFDTYRYKDCLFCKEYNGDNWVMYKRDPEELTWDLYDLIHKEIDAQELNFTDVKMVLKK